MVRRTSKIVLPSGNFTNGRKILEALMEHPLKREQIEEITGLGKSIIANTIPILKDIDYIRSFGYRGSNLDITAKGEELLTLLPSSFGSFIPELLEGHSLEQIEKSQALFEAYNTLKTHKKMNYKKLGKHLANKYGINWKSGTTASYVGRACVSYLSGLGLVDDYKIKPPRGRKIEGFRPQLSATQIFNNIKKYPLNEGIQLYTALDKSNVKSHRKSEANSLIELKLLFKFNNKSYKLTSFGKNLKTAIDTPKENIVFKDILLKNPHVVKLIQKIQSTHTKFSWKEIATLLENYNETKWNKDTRKWFATKFMSWLKVSGIAEQNHEHGKYVLATGVIGVQLSISDEIKEPPIYNKTPTSKTLNGEVLEGLGNLTQKIAYITAFPNTWHSDEKVETAIIDALEQIKMSQDIRLECLVEHLEMDTKKAFKDKDIKIMSTVAKTALKLFEKEKESFK